VYECNLQGCFPGLPEAAFEILQPVQKSMKKRKERKKKK
jgi:hypothetical protein